MNVLLLKRAGLGVYSKFMVFDFLSLEISIMITLSTPDEVLDL
jgi:hypothetical protein